MADINETRVAKIQVRRGMRKDLPNPLSPGEFGLCTDTNELFIGGDSSSLLGGLSTRTIQLDSTLNASSLSTTVLNNQLIEFAVKRDILTGDGATSSFALTSLESGVEATWPVVTRHSESTRTVTQLVPANENTTPQIVLTDESNGLAIAHYRIDPSYGSSAIDFSTYEIPLSTDTIYVVHYKKSEVADELVSRFNGVEDTASADYSRITTVSSIDSGGSATYVVGDVLTVSGGTSTVDAELTVTGVDAGIVTSAVVSEKGNYTALPSNPVSTTGGGGSGATFNLSSETISYVLTESQISFDESSGRGFISLTVHQYLDTIALASGSTTLKEALEAYINRKDNIINAVTTAGLGIHTMISEVGGYLYGANINTAGTDYAVEDILTLTGGTGVAAELKVTAVDAIATGVITGLAINTLGNYSGNPGSTAVATTTPSNYHASDASLVASGTGYTELDELVIEGGTVHVTDTTIAGGGSGYVINDRITATAGTFGTAVEVLVTNVNVGAVTGVQITIPGAYTVFPTTSSATTSDGSGTGCTLDLVSSATVIRVDTISGSSVSTFTVITAGTYSTDPGAGTLTTVGGTGTGATFTLTRVQPSDTATADLLYSSDTTADPVQDFRDGLAEIGYTGTFVLDGQQGYLVHTRQYAVLLIDFLNDNFIQSAGITVAQIAHLRSNIKLIQDTDYIDVAADEFIQTAESVSLAQTSVAASLDTDDESATGIRYSATTCGSVFINYVLSISDGGSTFDCTRVGRLALAFPTGVGAANTTGLSPIADIGVEVDLLGSITTMRYEPDLTVPRIEFGAKVARYVATAGHATVPAGAPLADSELGGLTFGVEYTWADPDHTYYGFLTYVNTFTQTATVKLTISRFSHL